MAIGSIRENISALEIIQQIKRTGSNLETNLTRISSGLRINSPADNVGGFVVSRKLESEFRGLSQAAEDVQSGVNLLSVTTNAVQDVLDELQTIRTKAQAAANSLPGDTALRQSLQSEIEERLSEINQIASTTKFNGQRLLNGSFTPNIGFRAGTRDFGGNVAFGAENTTLLGSSFLNIGRVQQGSAEIKSGSDATFNAGISPATDIAVSTAQFLNGGAAAAGADSLTGANFTINRVTLTTNGSISFSGTLANGTTGFAGTYSVTGASQVSNLVAAIQSTIDSAESAIGINTAGGTNALETNVALNTTTGRLDFSSGKFGNPSQFDIDFTVRTNGSVTQTTFGASRLEAINNEQLATAGTGAKIGNSLTAITGSTFATGQFNLEVVGVTAGQNQITTSNLGFFTNASLTTAVVSTDQIQNAFIGSISLEVNDTITINGTDPDGTNFSTEFTVTAAANNIGDGLVRTFADLIDELNNRDRSDIGFGFNGAVATLTGSGTIQLLDDLEGTSSTSLTFTATDVGNALNAVSNSTTTTAGTNSSATVRLAGGPAVAINAGETVTLFGDTSLSTNGVAPQVTLRFGNNFSVGTDLFQTTANLFQGTLNGGKAVQFSPGTQATFIAGEASVGPAAKGQRVTLDFDSILDITALASSGGETFYLSSSSKSIGFQIGGGSDEQLNLGLGDVRTDRLGTSATNTVDDIDVTTVTGATAALDVIDDAIEQATLLNGRLGGVQARLEDRISNLQTSSLNTQNAYNSIVSADIAKETTNLAINSVLLEAQASVLVQANATSGRVFEILYGLD